MSPRTSVGDPPGDCSGDRSGDRLRPVSHSAFRESVTRMLLSSDGSTTRLLEATVGPLSLRVLHQAVGTAAHCPDTIRTALGLAPEAQIINRCSALVDADSRPVSLNHVVAPFVPHSRLGDIVSGTAAGIGPELARQHVEHRRELLACGLALWPDTPGPRLAAAKVYVIRQGEQRLMYIREMFNPDVIPAATNSATPVPVPISSPAVERASGPRPAPRHPDATAAPARQPGWRGSGAAEAWRERIEAMPGLVTAAECDGLRSTLALVAAGRGFVIQVGDGAETFDRCTQDAVESRHALIRLLATAAGYGMGTPVAAVGRLAGRFTEPPRADLASSKSEAQRRSDPEQMLQAYLQSAAVLHALHNADQQADVRWIRWLRDQFGRRKVRSAQAEAVIAEMDFALQFGASGTGWPQTFVSHEALALDYERALVRADGAGRVHGSSGHLLSIAEHTRDVEGAHVAFAASIANPVAVRLGPHTDPHEVLDLCRRLNPEREPGRLTLIVGMGGADRLGKALPGMLNAVEDAGHPVVWVCDPTRADAGAAVAGRQARQTEQLDDVLAEIAAFYDAHAEAGTHAGGLHLEAAAQDLAADGDPRLHPLQALECVLHAVDLATAVQRTKSATVVEPATAAPAPARDLDLCDTEPNRGEPKAAGLRDG